MIPFSQLHDIFTNYQKNLVPNGTENETRIVLSLFSILGFCRLLSNDELSLNHFNEDVYEFPDLSEISEVPFLPSEAGTENQKILCVVCLSNPLPFPSPAEMSQVGPPQTNPPFRSYQPPRFHLCRKINKNRFSS